MIIEAVPVNQFNPHCFKSYSHSRYSITAIENKPANKKSQ